MLHSETITKRSCRTSASKSRIPKLQYMRAAGEVHPECFCLTFRVHITSALKLRRIMRAAGTTVLQQQPNQK